MARHNELRDGVVDHVGKAFIPAHVRDDSKIFTGRAVWGGKPKPKTKARGHHRRTRGGRRGIS